MMEEQGSFAEKDPTVLEYLKTIFQGQTTIQEEGKPQPETTPKKPENKFGLISIACFFLGQFLIEYLRESAGAIGIILFAAGLVLAFFAFQKKNEGAEKFWSPDSESAVNTENTFRIHWFLASVAAAVLAFIIYRGGRLTPLAVLFWALSIAFFLAAFWKKRETKTSIKEEILSLIKADRQKFLIGIAIVLIVVFFQFGKISSIPTEMISAQVDSYLTVAGIHQGGLGLWFPNNVVSEPLSYYWAALLTSLLAGELSFTGLKFAYALAGLISIFYLFKLGSLLFDKTTAAVAALLLGVGFWPILQQRAVLGYGLVLPVLLPALYYLFKSVMRNDLNSLLLSSLFVGLGLLTNKILLVLPFVSILVLVLLGNRKGDGNPKIPIGMRIALMLAVIIIVCLPLISVILTNGKDWFSPILNNLRVSEISDGQNPFLIFIRNLFSAMGIVNWFNRSSWVDGIANRGAVDWVTAAAFLVGLSQLIFAGWREDKKKTLSLLLLMVLFLLPSAISIAVPQENPSLSKALGAVIPLTLIAAKGLTYVVIQIGSIFRFDSKYKNPIIYCLFLFLIIMSNNRLITRKYAGQYQLSAWNASEMAQVIKRYETGQQGSSQAYILGYPHWVDHRAVSILSGRPDENYLLDANGIEATTEVVIPKIFIINPFDKESISTLQSTYPNGVITTYQSLTPEKDFLIFIAGQ